MKINHYAKPINSDYSVPWESLLIEGSLCIICGVMAIAGYQSGVALMAVPAAIVAVICGLLVMYTLFTVWRDKRACKLSAKDAGNSDES